jgi:glycosyltransferase involved in cell wall biosynthesis
MENFLTVVIATIGEPTLNRTIKSLVVSSIVPNQILVCIPKEKQKHLPELDEFGAIIKIIPTEGSGQVLQRAIGFRASSSKYTLQLDSDVILEKNCLKTLISFLEIHPKAAVSPQIYDGKTGKYHSYLTEGSSKFSKLDLSLLFYIANGSDGYRPGSISKCGENFGTIEGDGPTKCDWLPGGCILHRSENLVLENYFPFKGKAYGEDVLHSYFLTMRNIDLIQLPNARIETFFPSHEFSGLREMGHIQWRAFRIKFYIAGLLGKSRLRLAIYTVFYHILLIKRRVFDYD